MAIKLLDLENTSSMSLEDVSSIKGGASQAYRAVYDYLRYKGASKSFAREIAGERSGNAFYKVFQQTGSSTEAGAASLSISA